MRALLIASLLIAPAFASAQEQAAETQIPPASLEAVFNRLSEIRTLRGNFSQQRIVPGLSAPLISNGRFIISEMGLYWEQLQPFPSVLIADGQRLTQIVGSQAPTTITSAEQPIVASMGMVFLSVFRGDQVALSEHFEVDFETSESNWHMQLDPVSFPLNETISRLDLRGRLFIDEMVMTGPAEDTLTVQFLNVADEPPDLTTDEFALYSP